MNENQLVEALKAGSEQAMKEIMKQYGSLVKYIAIQIIGRNNEKDVEECISDIFLELWLKCHNFNPNKGSLKSYIVSIARHKALNRYYKITKDYERHIPLDEDMIFINPQTTEEEALQEIKGETITKLIDEMEEPDRSIFILRYFWYHKVKEIAKILHVDNKFVENKLYQNKEKLKKKLSQMGVKL